MTGTLAVNYVVAKFSNVIFTSSFKHKLNDCAFTYLDTKLFCPPKIETPTTQSTPLATFKRDSWILVYATYSILGHFSISYHC